VARLFGGASPPATGSKPLGPPRERPRPQPAAAPVPAPKPFVVEMIHGVKRTEVKLETEGDPR
jgi:hypothetical protein